MVQIGVELRKYFEKRSLSLRILGSIYSVFITVGHIIMTIMLLLFYNFIMTVLDISTLHRQLFSIAILYAFIFSFIFSSGTSMILSRYISNQIYNKSYENILPSMYGGLSINTITTGILGGLFYFFSPLDFWFKLSAYLLLLLLSNIFIMMVYISSVKEYKRIVSMYGLGIATTVFLSLVLLFVFKIYSITVLLYCIDIGMLIILLGFNKIVMTYFNKSSTKYFDFLNYFIQYPYLFFVNFFHAFGMYSHNFTYWFSDIRVIFERTYLYAPDYDLAAYVAMLTIMPATIIFMIRIETTFYYQYKKYLWCISNGTLEDIDNARKEMIQVLYKDFTLLAEIQLIISIIFITGGISLLPMIGMTIKTVELFPFISIGFYFAFLIHVVITIMLYFDNHKHAFLVAGIFAGLNTVLSIATIYLGNEYYGLGIIGAGVVSLIVGIRKLEIMLKDVDYIIFCDQALPENKQESPLMKLVQYLNK